MSIEIPKFPILYKTNNKGKTYQWKVEIEKVDGDGETYNICVTFGEQEGAQQSHKTHITKGKVKRSVLEQAILEAQSKWNEKHNRDAYRSETEHEDGIHTNSITKVVVRPMLANTFDKSLYYNTKSRAYRISFPAFVQRKYDGIRCIASWDHSTKLVKLESRKGTEFTFFRTMKLDIANLLYDNGNQYSSIFFDGELYTEELNFETINGVTRITKGTPSIYEELIHYHIYDFYDPTHPELTYRERKSILDLIICPIESKLRMVSTENVESLEDVKRLHDLYVQEGFEGIMIRDPNGIYENNKRSKYLQKYKEFMEEEFPIVGFTDGEGIDKGLVIFKCSNKNGQEFSVKPRGTHEYRRNLYENANSLIGKQLTVIFQEYSADGIPRFPVGKAIREDI